jgi:hypothetical protein
MPYFVFVMLFMLLFFFQQWASRAARRSHQIPLENFVEEVATHDGLIPSKEGPSQKLPQWIQSYLRWHQSVRAQFPGDLLFTDPAAPNLLLRTCLGLCGGLNDRLGQLPWDLYLANQTNRILLLHWHRPVSLESFLIPNELDWTVPKTRSGFFPSPGSRIVSRGDMILARDIPELFADFNSEQPTDQFWSTHMDVAINRATAGHYRNHKVLRHRLLGHLNEDQLEVRLRTLGETDMIHWTESFGNIFRMFFRPAAAIQGELNRVFSDLQITAGSYSAVHCRVRHPKASPAHVFVKGKNDAYPADKAGLPWIGETQAFAIATATKALKCARQAAQNLSEPTYFLSDSNDLVRYIAHELTSSKFVSANATILHADPVHSSALQTVDSMRIVARESSLENAHIDLQKGREPAAYYATFVDLLLAVNARCVTYGIGYYAVLATKISGTKCKNLYQEEAWGGSENKRNNTHVCRL